MEECLDLCYELLKKHGVNSQIAKTIEELTELSLALQHTLQGKATKEQVVEEIADCFIMLTQMKYAFCTDDEFTESLNKKIIKAAKTLL